MEDLAKSYASLGSMQGEMEVFKVSKKISRAKFCSWFGVAAYQLRDYLKVQSTKAERAKREQEKVKVVCEAASRAPNSGYRKVYAALRQAKCGQVEVGIEQVRHIMKEQNLSQPLVRKRRKASPAIMNEQLWPAGHRLQIDATKTATGWVYVVLDVESRFILAMHACVQVNAQDAMVALNKAVAVLKSQGITGKLLIMSDAGSDFTSHDFQQLCQHLGTWVRAKVNQKGGMGILERANRTIKYEFLFRFEILDLADLKQQILACQLWYNNHRLHSALDYHTPQQVFSRTVHP